MSLHRRILLSSESNGPDHFSAPPPPSRLVHSHVIIAVASASAASLFLALIYYAVLRHRRRRPPPISTNNNFITSFSFSAAADHPIWHIKTLGLDPAAIDSLGSYAHISSGDGTAADCSVCLAEILDGEIVRLLPKCSHVFHVQCIDTWLSSHVNCPLCRANVLDSPAAPAPLAADVEAIPVESPQLDREEEGGESTRVSVEVPESSGVLRSNSLDDGVVFRVDDEKEGNSSNSANLEKGQSESGRGFLFSRLGRARSSS